MITNFLFQNITLNASAEIGDLVFFTSAINNIGSGNNIIYTADNNGAANNTLLGTITDINFNPQSSMFNDIDILPGSFSITVTGELMTPPTQTSYLFFAKSNRVNKSTIKGYFNEVEFKNDSKIKAEMFSTACEIVESSK